MPGPLSDLRIRCAFPAHPQRPGSLRRARAGFIAQFSAKRFSDTPDLPVITLAEHADSTVAELVAKVTQLVPSLGQARRVAAGGGLRLVTEVPGKDQEAALGHASAEQS